MGEINKPDKRTFWKTGGVGHEGFTDINQQTTTGQPDLQISYNADDIYPALPDEGWIELDSIWGWNEGMIQCIQAHERTIYPPEQTPALFVVYRVNTDNMDWIPNEPVVIGDQRIYEGDTYQCLQSYTTQETWTPDVTPALWLLMQEDIPVWVQPTGAHDAYNIGDRVHFPTIDDPIYENLINANVWSPAVYPAGWLLIG